METTTSISIVCSDAKEPVQVSIPKNVWEACNTRDVPISFSTKALHHFAELIKIFPADGHITKSRCCRGECMQRMFQYLREHVWTAEHETEFYELVQCANHFGLDVLEYVLVAFLQDQFKVHHYHMSEEQAMATFPTTKKT